MLIVSDNLNAAYREVARAIEARDAGSVRELAHKATRAGADVIDLNVGPLSAGADGALIWLVEQVQEVSELPVSLDARSASAIVGAAERAVRKPILNAYGLRSARPDEVAATLIPYAAERGLEIILPAIGPMGPPLDPDERAGLAQELVGGAMGAGVDPGAIYVDPVIVHLGQGNGQDHSAAILDTMRLLTTIFDPPIKTIAGVEYLAQGAPPQLRSAITRVYLAMLAALGLDAAMVDVLDGATMRDIRLIKGLRNESLYSVSDAELK